MYKVVLKSKIYKLYNRYLPFNNKNIAAFFKIKSFIKDN